MGFIFEAFNIRGILVLTIKSKPMSLVKLNAYKSCIEILKSYYE